MADDNTIRKSLHPKPRKHFTRSSASITPVPQVYPFSRTGYYALVPSERKPPEPTKAATYTISVTPGDAKAG